MNFSDRTLTRYALSCTAAAMLAACGGSQPPIGATDAMPQTSALAAHADRGTSWMLPEAKGDDLLYSGQDPVYVFSYPAGESVGSLSVGATNGLCSDGNGDVFLTSQRGSSLTEYAHGGSQPIAYLTIPNGEGGSVFGCAVDPTTGNLAATFECNLMSQCASGNEIAVFPNATGTPTEYGGSNLPQFLYCGYDDAGNLFADGLAEGDSGILAELPEGSSKLTNISLSKSIKKVGQIQWDGMYMTIQDRLRASLYRLKISGSTAKVEGTTEFDEKGLAEQSWIQGSNIVIPYRRSVKATTTLGFWKYPVGGTPTKMISKKSWEHGGLAAFTGTTVSLATKR
jgi:hypothetical protein